ncbi:MAG: tetratricopeptide repeat protein [Flavobacteriales bacterium]|nr:tetratricopeptide repeat protein [Flavobacteriales bacterium]
MNLRFLILLNIVFLPFVAIAKDQAIIDSLQKILNTTKEDTTRINTLNLLALEFKSKLDTAISLSQQALTLAKDILDNDPNREGVLFGMGIAYDNLAVFNRRKGNLSNALDFNFKSLEIKKQLKETRGIAVTLGNIGLVYYNQGDYPKALDHYFKALRLFEEVEDSSRISIGLGSIGIVYRLQGNRTEALEYFFKALKISEELNKKGHVAVWLSNIGGVYQEIANASNDEIESQANYSKALEHYLKALKANEDIDRKPGIAINLGNIGLIYRHQGNNPEALKHHLKALELDQELGNKNGIARHLGNIGSLYTDSRQFKDAERVLLRSLTIADSIDYIQLVKDVSKSLSKLYEDMGQYEPSLDYYKQYTMTKDSLFNEAKSKDIGKIEAKHEFEKAEAERKRIQEEQARLETATKSRRDNLQYSGILIFLVLIFTGVFMLGKFSIPIRLAEGLIFFSFLLFFEFTLVLLDPYIEQYSSGAPAIKLAFNALLAGLIFPLHSFFETKLKGRMTIKQ